MKELSQLEIKVNLNKSFYFNVADYLAYCKECDVEPTREDMIEFFKEDAWNLLIDCSSMPQADFEIIEIE